MAEVMQRPGKIARLLKETARVMRITKKPSKDEFLNLMKVTGIGIAVIGLIGFIIFMAKQLLL